MPRALICGVSGQDGAFLAKLLLEKGYEVWGTSRDAEACQFSNLTTLGVLNSVSTISMASNDFRSVHEAIARVSPDEIYNLSGQSSVGLSFEQPGETIESIVTGTLNLLEGVRSINPSIKFYNAGSGECFGDVLIGSADEGTPFSPKSPYATAKVAAYWLVSNYRTSYNLYACTGILFNHESHLRPTRFVTQKIIDAAIRISQGSNQKLILGNIAISRDWGWSPEYVEAMWGMLQLDTPQDFVIATGEAYSLEEFIEAAFSELHLNWRDHLVIDSNLYRASEIIRGCGNPSKASDLLGWKPKYRMKSLVKSMIDERLSLYRSQ